MELKKLLNKISNSSVSGQFAELDIKAICEDSRKVSPGSLFVAREGTQFNGGDFINEAIAKGAVAVATQSEKSDSLDSWPESVCHIKIKDADAFLLKVVERFYGNPSRDMQITGVTGTNGKTTVTYLIESIFKEAKKPCGVIGTINYRIAGDVFPASHTTPGIIENQQFLNELLNRNIKDSVMEVSSHALEQGRVDLVDFKRAVFTNLTSDHIDYHLNQKNYFMAKAKLFKKLSKEAVAIINADDPSGQKIKTMTKAKILTFGIKNKYDYTAANVKLNLDGSKFQIKNKGREIKIDTKMIGLHNVYNILAAAVTCLSLGIDAAKIRKGILSLECVPGRLEKIESGQNFHVFVDYAHTEDGLKNVLHALREVHSGRLIVVFGCGGDRDKTKRPEMGKVASQLADYVILSSDNPRSEDPQSIIDDIIGGIEKDVYTVIADRREAIKHALSVADPNDVVLIAGKGHEDYQIFKNQTIHFDDREVVRDILTEGIKC